MNCFEFYGIPESFSPDLAALRRLFLQKSRELHPDFHAAEAEEKQAELLELSTINNRAFQTLADPESRMRHILELHGMLDGGGKNLPIPPAFLMEMMEINEAIDELGAGFSVSFFTDLKKQLAGVKAGLEAGISPVLGSWTAAENRPGELEQVLDFYLKSRYVLRAEEKLATFEPSI